MVVAIAALAVALGGTAYAGTQLAKNSVKARQIAAGAVRSAEVQNGALRLGDIGVSARDALRGQTGPVGPAGPAGAAGTTGQQGPPGPLVETLPSGATLRGVFASGDVKATATSSVTVDAISFPIPLASAPTPSIVPVAGAPTVACPGALNDPSAAPGNLCLYLGARENVVSGRPRVCDLAVNNCGNPTGAHRTGATVEAVGDADGVFYVSGTWAVTAP